MATTTTISTKELKRQAAACFEGKTIKVMLCSVGATGYTAESTVANWQSVEATGNGYTRFSATIGTSTYNATTARQELPVINAAFTASGGTIGYDRVVIYINGETYIHSLVVESPNIILAAGQTQTYAITLAQDD
tara:strand:- start:648 stop:1052 length:405 start_codon:yes stop_codon:yes gene_type:complete